MSKESGEKLKKGEATSKRILDAAAHCIATIGIEGSSITEIAKRARVSRGLVAHYFPEKKNLFRHVIDHIAQQAYRSIESPPSSATPIERVLHTAAANLEFFDDNPSYFKCMMLFYYFASIRSDFRAVNTMLAQRAVDRVEADLAPIIAASLKQGRKTLDGKLISESVHREVLGGIQKFFIVAHAASREEYSASFLAGLRQRLEALVSIT